MKTGAVVKVINGRLAVVDYDEMRARVQEKKRVRDYLNNATLEQLKNREMYLLCTDRMTLEEIGNIYGVTKECIRQTELRALNKMRTSGQEILMGYIG